MNHSELPLNTLANALKRRLEVIQDHAARELDPEKHLAALAEVSQEIDSLARSLPRHTHPRLLHFLEQASYSKALEFLETNDSK